MFGFGKGKIEIQLNNYNYSAGQTIQGTVSVALKKPLHGKELSISLVGQQRVVSGGIPGMSPSSSRVVTVYNFKLHLDGDKEYAAGNPPLVYPFKIVIPADINNVTNKSVAPAGAVGTILKTAESVLARKGRLTWYLIARLEVPGIDLKKKVQINIT